MAEVDPWDKYLPQQRKSARADSTEWTLTADGLPYILTTDTGHAVGPTDGQARFCASELTILRRAAGPAKLPRRLRWALHMAKATLGGEILSCWVDRDSGAR